jgi:hypothetical protein
MGRRKAMNKKELKEILEKHDKWRRDKEGGERADLSGANLYGAKGVIFAGFPNGWFALAYYHNKKVRVSVGCQKFTLPEAREYWTGKDDRREVMAALDYIETVLKIRGGKP